jgi:glycosyltransferase involved in cell wall biosynthesis
LNIACIATGWYPQTAGGLEKYAYGMMRAALRAGDSVDIFITDEPVPAEPRLNVIPIARPGDPLLKRALDARRAFARSFRSSYDVIDIHFAMNALPLIPFIDHHIPRVVHFQGPWADESRAEGANSVAVFLKRALEKFVYRRADRFIVLSGAFKDVLVAYGIDADRISVIPMGIDCNYFRPAADRGRIRTELGWPSHATIFFTARRLVNRVGLIELLEATAIVRKTRANFVVKIAGKGPLRGKLEEAIERLGLGDCVELLGFVSEEALVRCYQAASVTVLPTQALEGFGTIIAESLSCGTPVIVTPVGGMPEAIAPLSPDLIARSASPDDIAERMTAMLDGTLNVPAHETCRLYARENYDWDKIYASVRNVYIGGNA